MDMRLKNLTVDAIVHIITILNINLMKNVKEVEMSFFRMNGVSVPHLKHTATMKAETMPVPSSVVIPMNMHIGAPAKPVVKVGEMEGVGQLIEIGRAHV